MLIPTIINQDEDELYYSWLLRLAKANGFDEPRHFFTAYLYRAEKFKYIYPYYLGAPFHVLWKSLPELECSEMGLYRQLSIFDGISPLVNSSRCQRLINDAFGEADWLNVISPKMNPLLLHINICPECAKEDLENLGHFYFHRKHQMPGVTVCSKHHCALGVMESERQVNLFEMPTLNLFDESNEQTIQIATFAENLLNADTGLNLNDVFSLIDNRLRTLHAETASDELAVIMSSPIGHIANEQQVKQLCKLGGGSSRQYPDPATLIITLAALFDTDSPNTWKLEHENRLGAEKEQFSEYAHSLGYELVGGYHSNLVTLKHNDCGTEFIVTPYGFRHGWVCPHCSFGLSSEQAFNNLFAIESQGEYELVNGFEGMDNRITVRHLSCGREYSVVARRFIYENARCTCENELTQEKVRDRIRELTGDEYELISYDSSNHKAKIKHCVCGRTKNYKIYHFFDGHRCDCAAYIPDDEAIANYIKDYSCSRYEITGKTARYVYTVHDNETGNDIVIPRKKIIAELTRPTRSDLLPLEHRNEAAYLRKSAGDTMLDYLHLEYQTNEPIFSEDVTLFDDSEKNQITLSNLAKAGKLNHIATSIYSLPSKKCISDDAIVYNRYIVRKGKRIGYYRCASMAYELGLEHKPSDYSVVTNAESVKTPQRKLYIGTIAIHIKGRPELIDEQNWLVFATFDFLLAYKQYTKASTRRVISALVRYIKANNGGNPLSPEAFDELVDNCKARNIKTYIKNLLELLYKAEVSA